MNIKYNDVVKREILTLKVELQNFFEGFISKINLDKQTYEYGNTCTNKSINHWHWILECNEYDFDFDTGKILSLEGGTPPGGGGGTRCVRQYGGVPL